MTLAEILGFVLPTAAALGAVYRYVQHSNQLHKKDHVACTEKNKNLERRIIALESDSDSGLPEWRKDIDGKFIYANGEFVRFYLLPLRKTFKDIEGRVNSEIDFFSDSLKQTLDELDIEVQSRGFAARSDVMFHDKALPAIIIKRLITVKGSDIIYYRGMACPQFKNR